MAYALRFIAALPFLGLFDAVPGRPSSFFCQRSRRLSAAGTTARGLPAAPERDPLLSAIEKGNTARGFSASTRVSEHVAQVRIFVFEFSETEGVERAECRSRVNVMKRHFKHATNQ